MSIVPNRTRLRVSSPGRKPLASIWRLFGLRRLNPMFNNLEDRIRHDEAEDATFRQRAMKGLLVANLSTSIFAGLYFVVRILD